MCYILLEFAENRNAKSCDVPSINDFLEEVLTFMANSTQDMSELCEYAKSLTARCQKLMNTQEHQAQPPQAEEEGREGVEEGL